MNLLRSITLAIKNEFLYTRRVRRAYRAPTRRFRAVGVAAETSPCL